MVSPFVILDICAFDKEKYSTGREKFSSNGIFKTITLKK